MKTCSKPQEPPLSEEQFWLVWCEVPCSTFTKWTDFEAAKTAAKEFQTRYPSWDFYILTPIAVTEVVSTPQVSIRLLGSYLNHGNEDDAIKYCNMCKREVKLHLRCVC